MKFWQRLFTAFLQRFHLMRFSVVIDLLKSYINLVMLKKLAKIYLSVCLKHQGLKRMIY